MYINKMGEIISQKRKESGLTQAELAEYIGVSKPAVSKWESGHSMPDIALLPELASFFDITIDELMGYQPQMTEKNIDLLYADLTDKLLNCSADEVFSECRTYIKKYYFCWQLILRMSEFMYNHYTFSCKPDSVLSEILEYTERISNQCDNGNITKRAGYIKTCCLIKLGDLESAEVSAEKLIEPVTNTPVLLSFIYNVQGKAVENEQIILSYIEQNLQLIFTAIPNACIFSDKDHEEYLLKKFSSLLMLFKAEKYYPEHLLRFYFTAAIVYCNIGKTENALKYLWDFIQLLDSIRDNSLRREKNCFQKAHHQTIQTYLGEENFDMKTVFSIIIKYLSENNSFRPLKNESEFNEILLKLQEMADKYFE